MIKAKLITYILVPASILVASLVATPVLAVDCVAGVDCITTGANKVQTGGDGVSLEDSITNITNLLMFVLGAISVVMLILGGIRYTTSNGNPEQIKAAKNTIMYAIIGLVVAILAWAIVSWIVGALTTSP